MAATIKVAVYTNSDDAFVAWAPSEFIAGCRGFLLERARKAQASVEVVENRVGFRKVDPSFRAFLEGDLGTKIGQMLTSAQDEDAKFHAALYELADEKLEDGLIALESHLYLILANGSDKAGDGNAAARTHLNAAGIPTINRLLKSQGLGHNKFVVLSDRKGPQAV